MKCDFYHPVSFGFLKKTGFQHDIALAFQIPFSLSYPGFSRNHFKRREMWYEKFEASPTFFLLIFGIAEIIL